MSNHAYAELAITSNFSFLRGGSHPEEYSAQAAKLGLAGIGIADRNTVTGIVRAHEIAQKEKLRFAPGTRLVFTDGTPDILCYPRDREAWGRLTRLLTRGKRRAPKGDCFLTLHDLLQDAEGQNLILCPPASLREATLSETCERLKEVARHRLWIAAQMNYRGDDERRLNRLAAFAHGQALPLIAINDVLYHHPARRELQDVLTCIREHTTIEAAGKRLMANAERHLKPPAEMARLFRKAPDAITETLNLLSECRFSLTELKPDYPDETQHGYATSQEALEAFARAGAEKRYQDGVPEKIRRGLDYELKLIRELNYAPYFLTVHDIVKFAREQGILCQGRGSAANSTVCFCLGVTEVDPTISDLLFERFLSAERNEPPDIDVDFEHERREEVMQYVYRKYGRERTALTATLIRYRGRSAIRDVGKAFGLSDDVVGALAGSLWGWSADGVTAEKAKAKGLDPQDPRLARALKLAHELIDFPRHLSQHVGGFLISARRLDETVPIENAAMDDRTVIEWNKDDLETLRMLKVDLLALGMLSCLRKSYDLMRSHYGLDYTNATLPSEEPEIYRMLTRADSIGVFQVESRAQMSMLPRLRPEKFYDLVIEVAIVRPGPIQGGMVHPYLRRKQGLEPVSFPSPSPEHGPADEMQKVLSKTLGVPLFQEQAMKIAIVAAEFPPAEADRLRRAMATFRRTGDVPKFREQFVGNMIRRGYPPAFAAGCFSQIEGFGEYGFPESHAASFALLVYASAWIKCRYPDVFACAILNSLPMGFYEPAQLVRDAEEHGVAMRGVDVNESDWDCTLERENVSAIRGRLQARHAQMRGDIRGESAVRLGFRQISGFREDDAKRIAAARGGEAFSSLRDFWLRTKLPPSTLRRLAQADAFASLKLSRREALWEVRALKRVGEKDDLPLFARAALANAEPDARLAAMAESEQVIEDYRHLRLSLRAHPVSFLRDELVRRGIVTAAALRSMKDGLRVSVAGLVLVRQRPGSGNTIFVTLEDETGIANAIFWNRVFERFRPIVMGSRFVCVSGALQSESGVIHVVAEDIVDLTPMLSRLKEEPAIAGLMPKGRNFH
jgi:error-prone DNA polymerase